mmetsp:Transcript_30680/g.102074  ORF Transcript_30680/g.102074 Transcript_30680/m.102074 type:complete len:300 (-) Transcript_30680:191-1090(-)
MVKRRIQIIRKDTSDCLRIADSPDNRALVCGDHVLDVDERIFTTMNLQHLKGLCDNAAKIHVLALVVIDLVTNVEIVVNEDVEHRQELPEVGHQSFADHVTGHHQGLEDLQHGANNDRVPGVQGRLQWDDELRHHRKDLRAALLEHVVDALDGQEAVGLLLLARAVEEDGQVVVVDQLLDVDLPSDLPTAASAVEDGDGQIAAVVEDTELRRGHRPHRRGAGLRGWRRQAARDTAGANERRVHGAKAVAAAAQPCAGHTQSGGRGALLQGAALGWPDLHVLPSVGGQVRREVAHARMGA